MSGVGGVQFYDLLVALNDLGVSEHELLVALRELLFELSDTLGLRHVCLRLTAKGTTCEKACCAACCAKTREGLVRSTEHKMPSTAYQVFST